MEENKEQDNIKPSNLGTSSVEVGNPVSSIKPPGKLNKKKGKNPFLLIGVGVVILVVAILWFLFQEPDGADEDIVDSGETQDLSAPPTLSPTPAPTPIDKDEIDFEILNGTGIAKEASFLQGKLRDLGYTSIELSNSDDQDNETTVVTFSDELSEALIDEITQELEDIYKDVETKTSSSLSMDIQIITGLRVGQTPKPSSAPTPEPTDEPNPTTSPTVTPTASPISTP